MEEVVPVRLPVHGFVLAGGKSSRMGADKALLRFCGRPMVEIAVEKLRGFCAEVTIAGNRGDLAGFAPVVTETRVGVGPGAGIEAGLRVAKEAWAMFIPVDVPFVPEELLRRWAVEAMRVDMTVSYLGVGRKQPTFCSGVTGWARLRS
jgi:molybdopterin-guanine dinucleotide biosynthesis protein A